MAVVVTRQDLSAAELRREAARSRDAGAARRMLAIALVLEGASREEAAESCGMDRQTLRDWVHRYNDEGLAGLVNRRAPGPAPRLSNAQEAMVARWVEEGPDLERDGVVRWRCVDIQARIACEWGVTLHERSVGKSGEAPALPLLHRLRLACVSTRPRHPKADAVAQASFGPGSPPL